MKYQNNDCKDPGSSQSQGSGDNKDGVTGVRDGPVPIWSCHLPHQSSSLPSNCGQSSVVSLYTIWAWLFCWFLVQYPINSGIYSQAAAVTVYPLTSSDGHLGLCPSLCSLQPSDNCLLTLSTASICWSVAFTPQMLIRQNRRPLCQKLKFRMWIFILRSFVKCADIKIDMRLGSIFWLISD